MPLSAGTKLGPYEILALIGAGGMGEVYKARDTRLNRIVAIKVSKEQFSERFEREAKAIATLNHPNICQIYDIGPNYLVMEYVEGTSPKGPLPPEKAVECATQILDALDAAHHKGITHRDLKPANVLVTGQGIKLLDFGLAKQNIRPGEDDSTVAVTRALTSPGQVMGTLQYMSPEQLHGKEVDARSDLFSFGCVLYELLTGKRAFTGESQASVIAAILEREPALPEVGRPLDRVVKRSLAKDPDQRFQTARDLKAALVWAMEQAPATGTSGIVRRSRWFHLAWIGAAVMAIATISLLAWREFSTRPGVVWRGTLLGGPEVAMGPRISPDGHTLAFQAMERGVTQVAVMKPDTGNWTILTHKRNGGQLLELNWSPDGNRIFFDRYAELPLGIFSVPALGGEEQLVLEDAMHPEPLPDGSLLIQRLNAERKVQLYRFWPDSGRLQSFPIEVHERAVSATTQVFPNGREVLILGDLLGPGRQGAPHLGILNLPDGHIRWLSMGATDDSSTDGLAVSRDGQSVLISRRRGDITEIVSLPASGRGSSRVLFGGMPARVNNLDTGSDGTVYLDELDEPVHILRFSPTGGPAKQISSFPGPAGWTAAMVLPDGRTVVTMLRAGRPRLMVVEAGKEPLPLVNTSEETCAPVTAAGSDEVAFVIGPEPHHTLAIANLSNGRVTRRIAFDKGHPRSLAFSPDRKMLYCAAAGTIWSIPVMGGELRRLHAGESVAMLPGGKSLLVEMVETGKSRLLEVPLDGGAEKDVPLNGPLHLAGAAINSSGVRDGKLAVPLTSLDAWFDLPGVVDLATGNITQVPVDFVGDFHDAGWAPDGNLVGAVHETRYTIWKMQPEGR